MKLQSVPKTTCLHAELRSAPNMKFLISLLKCVGQDFFTGQIQVAPRVRNKTHAKLLSGKALISSCVLQSSSQHNSSTLKR